MVGITHVLMQRRKSRGGVTVTTSSAGSPGAGENGKSEVVAEVPVKVLAVGLRPGRVFTVATLHLDRAYDEIYCLADDQATRDEWISIFRQLDVPVFDLSAPLRHHLEMTQLLSRRSFDDNGVLSLRFKAARAASTATGKRNTARRALTLLTAVLCVCVVMCVFSSLLFTYFWADEYLWD
jgi:hypothetical protein